ncbi:MAG: glycosyltransferase family 2 protein [Phycicoccus sp.]|nr:glycosyltransferase family 2 protein [Phycicoccus sp.]
MTRRMSPARAVLIGRTTLGTLSRTGQRWLTDPGHRAAQALVGAGLVLPTLPKRRRAQGEVWAITMVRDEADILPDVLDHLSRQGVDRILVSDNGSVDGTLELLHERARRGQILLARDSEPGYYQGLKMTRLARAAARAGADWIVPFDADEFWFGPATTLVDALRETTADIVSARMYNVFPTIDGGWGLDRSPQLHGKVAFRASRIAVLAQGNHSVDAPGVRVPPAELELPIAHFPWRSIEQFRRKVRQGAQAYQNVMGESRIGGHWRELGALPDAKIDADWSAMLRGESVEGMHWYPRGPLTPADPRTWTSWRPGLTESGPARP